MHRARCFMFYGAAQRRREKKNRDVRLYHISSFWEVHAGILAIYRKRFMFFGGFNMVKRVQTRVLSEGFGFYRLTSWLLLKMNDIHPTTVDALLFDRRRLLQIYANFYYQRRFWVSFASELPFRTWFEKMKLFDSNQPTPKNIKIEALLHTFRSFLHT